VSTGTDITVAALRPLMSSLLARWEQGPDQAQTPRGRRFEAVRIKSVITLAAHAHRLGRAVATLVDAGFGLETAPTVRAVVEYGMTAQWLLQYGDDASYGFATEAQRQRAGVGRTLRKLTEAMQLESADNVLAMIDADAQHVIDSRKAATASARHFEALCQDFELGDGYYFAYRVLSALVHPGPTVCEAYMDEHDPPVFRLEPKPVRDNGETWLYQTCCGLVWAARAVDILDREHPNRRFLRNAARQLGIPLELQLTGEAFVRREQERQKRGREQP
jgi:hypothetical protein